MKLKLKNAKHKLNDYWNNLYHSTKKKMSQGAQNISKVITSPHKDNWRRPPK